MKLKQLIEARGAIQKLLDLNGLPAVTSLRLARFWRQAQPELEAYEAERTKLAKAFSDGRLKNNNTEYDIPAEKMPLFFQQLAEMQAEEIELKMKPFDMVDFKSAGLSVNGIFALEAIGLLLVDWETLEETAVPEPSPNGHKEPETA